MPVSDFKNTSVAPTSELAAAYEELQQLYTFKSKNALDIAFAEVQNSTSLRSSREKFINSVISYEGSYYTSDLFGEREISKQYDLRPLSSLTRTGDVACYGSRPGSPINKSEIYNDLLTFIGMRNTLTQTVEASSAGNQSSTSTSTPTDIPNAPEAERDASAQAENVKNLADIASILNSKINNKPDSPDRVKNPHVSFYRYANPRLSIASVASDFCNTFFNGIDSINMSLCVPYIKINIIDRFNKKFNRYPTMSLISFLKQSSNLDINDKIFFNARPNESPLLIDANSQVAKAIQSGKVIGMESFLSPATLLPDPTEILSNPRRLDTSVPLMSLEGLSIHIQSNGTALFSKKSANLNIILHDRSRLKDISTLVSAASYSSIIFDIEWGWIHPHAAPEFNNPVARFLNALRFREIFNPLSFTMNSETSGAIKISLDLLGSSVSDMLNGSVTTGQYVKKSYALDALNRYISSSIISDNNKIKDAIVNVLTPLNLSMSAERRGELIDRKFIDDLIVASQKDSGSDDEDLKLLEKLNNMIDDSSTPNRSNTDVLRIMRNNLKRVNVTGFGTETFSFMKGQFAGIDQSDYTSVGAFLTTYVAMPLASLGIYDEVQVHTFCFNDKAGKMANLPISDACIKYPDLLGTTLESNDAVSKAVAIVTDYLKNPNLPTYGLSSITGKSEKKTDSTTDTASVDVTTGQKEKTATAVSNSPESAKDVTGFVTPDIRQLILTVPVKRFVGGSNLPQVDSTRLIAQIIIYDNNATPVSDVITKAYEYTKPVSTSLTGAALSLDEIKNLAKIAYPSIVYGTTNSVIEQVSVSTKLNDALSQQKIIDMGKEIAVENSKSETLTDLTNLTVFPVSIDIGMIGCPIIERGQLIYLDMGTGTNIDAVYAVTSVRHEFRGMKYNTNLTLTMTGQGVLTNINTVIDNYKKSLDASNS